MIETMRTIQHPGPSAAERVHSMACCADRMTMELQAGCSLNQSVAEAFATAGLVSGYVHLRDAAVEPLRYVIPAVSPDGQHAAWYSETFAPQGVCIIEDAGLIVGLRDRESFLHCHGLWRLPDGSLRMGHLLPLESRLSRRAKAEVWGVSGAAFEVQDDPETNFRLFQPITSPEHPVGRGRAFIAVLKPNVDVCRSIETLCRNQNVTEARIMGIGSLVSAEFETSPFFDSFATEVLIRDGEVRKGHCSLDIALVGLDGSIAEGRLRPGCNPVCVTFELLIVTN